MYIPKYFKVTSVKEIEEFLESHQLADAMKKIKK